MNWFKVIRDFVICASAIAFWTCVAIYVLMPKHVGHMYCIDGQAYADWSFHDGHLISHADDGVLVKLGRECRNK